MKMFKLYEGKKQWLQETIQLVPQELKITERMETIIDQRQHK